jgi:hypothetical protein
LANVISKQKGDLMKAEELARESLRIRSLIFNSNAQIVGISCNLVANILRKQGKLGDETRGFYELSLDIAIRNNGPDGLYAADGHLHIGTFYCKVADAQTTVNLEQKQLLLAKFHTDGALRIYLKIHGPTHPDTLSAASLLTTISSELSQISPN